MNSNDIQNILDNFINKENTKSIFIDGDWGICKTYQVVQYLNSLSKSRKKDIYYLSAFGYNSINELHTRIYSLLHPHNSLIKHGISILSTVAPLIPQYGNIVQQGLERTVDILNETPYTEEMKDKIKENKSKILIIDDIERTNIPYIDLVGYFNQLFLSNFRVICIGSSSHLNGISDYDLFKEKIFHTFI